MNQHFEVARVALDEILGMRDEYRREMACQIVHDSWHARGFTTSYLIRVDNEVVAYGSVGGAPGSARDILKEFFVRQRHRGDALHMFRALVAASGAKRVEAQTNDVLLTLMLYDCAVSIKSGTILFADGHPTTLAVPFGTAELRPLRDTNRAEVFAHTTEPVGDWGVEVGGAIVATGGVLFHYNPPYGDLYMEVAPEFRRRGVGSYLIQELKRICYESGHVPAARCDHTNVASRLTLQRAGMLPCARILRGRLSSGE